MPLSQDSPAVVLAKRHIEAWSCQRWDDARAALADDVHVTAATTQPIMEPTDLTGADAYMEGLKYFAAPIVPGSAEFVSAIGDEQNAIVLVTVRAPFGPDGSLVTLPGARLYLFDVDNKIKGEQVVFFAAQG